MKLYSIQTVEAYNQLLKNNILYCLDNKYIWSEFLKPYSWMINQMELKIGKKEYENQYPIWAWFQYSNSNKKKPNLKDLCLLEKGTNGVRIEFEKPNHEVLLSDFIKWYYVLNHWYIPTNNLKEECFNDLLKQNNLKFGDIENYTSEINNIIQNSWNKIFDLNKINNKSVQATIWNIKKEEIINVDYFKAK